MLNAVALVSDNVIHWTRWYDPWFNTRAFCDGVFKAEKDSTDICLDGSQIICESCARYVDAARTRETEQLTGIRCPWFDPIMGYFTADDCVKAGHGIHKVKERPKAKPLYCHCLAKEDNNLYVNNGHTGTRECCSDYCNDCGVRACFACDCGEYDRYEPDDHFRDEGGESALRAATGARCPHHGCHKRVGLTANYCANCSGILNPRKFKCPTCDAPNVLTQADKDRGYQCDRCADRAEGKYYGSDY